MGRMRIVIIGLLALALLLAACGGDDDSGKPNSSNSAGSSNQNAAATNATFSITYSTGLTLTSDNARVRDPQFAAPMLEVDENGGGNGFLRLEFDNETVAVGTEPLFRVTIAAMADVNGAAVQIGCSGTADDTANLSATITAVNGNRASGSFSFGVGNCDDYMTGETVQFPSETVTVTGTFENVPLIKVGG